jgi:hypothetical protein
MSGKSGSGTPYVTRTRSPTANVGGVDGFLGMACFHFFFFVDIVSRSRRSVRGSASADILADRCWQGQDQLASSTCPVFIPAAISCTLAGTLCVDATEADAAREPLGARALWTRIRTSRRGRVQHLMRNHARLFDLRCLASASLGPSSWRSSPARPSRFPWPSIPPRNQPSRPTIHYRSGHHGRGLLSGPRKREGPQQSEENQPLPAGDPQKGSFNREPASPCRPPEPASLPRE